MIAQLHRGHVFAHVLHCHAGASKKESSTALILAEHVRLQQGKPPEVRIVRVLAGQEEDAGFFAECFAIEGTLDDEE